MSDDDYVWVPERLLKRGWLLVPGEESRPCRAMIARYTFCRRPSAARLLRSRIDSTQGVWWHYCEEHLYGRVIRDGELMTRVHRDTEVARLHLSFIGVWEVSG